MRLTEQSQAQGEALERGQGVVQCPRVVHHLAKVALRRRLVVISFEQQQLTNRGLRTFDPRAEDRLEPHVGAHEDLGTG